MKKLVSCFPLLILCIVVIGQHQPDTSIFKDDLGHDHYKITSYYPEGQLRSVGFYSAKTGPLSKEEAFMRGVKLEGMENQLPVLFSAKNDIPSLDSALFYSVDGVLQERQFSSRRGGVSLTYEYEEEGNLVWIIRKELRNSVPIQYIALGRLVFLERRQVVEGRIGDVMQIDIPIAIKGEAQMSIRLSSSSQRVKIVNQRVLDPARDSLLSLAITVPSQITEEYVKLEDEAGNSFSLPITIIGYDLFSQDFESSTIPDVVFPLAGRKQLVIKTEEAKLIRLYRDEELIDNYPTGRQRSEIDIKGFKRGHYLVEAVDFSANEKRYCKIRIE